MGIQPARKSNLLGKEGVLGVLSLSFLTSTEDFKHKWNMLGSYRFNSQELSTILYTEAKQLNSRNIPKDHYSAAFKVIQQSIPLWEREALMQMGHFADANLFKSFWAFSAMGIAPSGKFLQAA